ARMLGYELADLMTKNIDRDIYEVPGERSRILAHYGPIGAIDGALVRWLTRDGRSLAIRLYGHMTERSDGTSIDVWVHDVTAVEAQREELKQTATILDVVVRQMPALYWVVDRDLRITRTGGAVLEVLGYPADRYVGTTLQSVHRTEPGTADSIGFHHR